MNTQEGREKFKNFRILLDSVCSYSIVMIMPMKKLTPKEDYVVSMAW